MKDNKQLLNEQLFGISVEEHFAAHLDRLPTEPFMIIKLTQYII